MLRVKQVLSLCVALIFCFGGIVEAKSKYDQYDLRLQRYGLGSSQEHAHSIKQSIDHYSAYVKNYAEITLSKENIVEKELLYLTHVIQAPQSLDKSVVLLERIIFLREKIVGQRLSNEKQNVADNIICAVALRCSSVLADSVRAELLKTLNLINGYLSYWKEQRGRPAHYFFHKSPHKWIIGKDQESEVRENIYDLERLQNKLCQDLGSLVGHTYESVTSETVEHFYVWIDQLCNIIPLHTSIDVQQGDFADRTLCKLHCVIAHVRTIKEDILSLISTAKKPNHLMRNWIMYTGLCGAVYCAYKNPEFVGKWIGFDALQEYAKSINGLFEDNIKTPIINTFNILRGEDIDHQKQMDNLKEIAHSIDDKVAALKEIAPSIASSGTKDVKNMKKEILSSVVDSIQSVLVGSRCEKAKANNIMKAVKEGNFGPFKTYLNESKINSYSPYCAANEIVTNVKGYAFEAEGTMIPSLLDIIENYTVAIDEGVLPATQDVVKLIIEVAHLIKTCSEDYYNVKKQTKLTAQLLFLMPVGFTVGSIAALYKWATKHDYAPLRGSLAEVQLFFIENTSPLTAGSYGKLLFLLHKLKRQAMMHISSRDKLQHDFLVDITKLESMEFSNETKRLIVENMRLRYPFLSVTG